MDTSPFLLFTLSEQLHRDRIERFEREAAVRAARRARRASPQAPRVAARRSPGVGVPCR